jgi:FKBP-type peptidyl-prolyl cis-trans isomerase FklB
MKTEMKLIRIAFLALLTINASAQTQPPAPGQTAAPRVPPALTHPQPKPPPPMPDKDKLSYSIGFNIANSIKRDGLEVDVDTIATAMKDVLAGRPTRLNDTEVKATMSQFQQAFRAKMAADREKQMAENKTKGEEYLAKNGKAPGVTTLPNGIQYRVLKEGTGEMPKPTDNVTVSYKGSLTDGTVFDQNDHFPTAVTGRTIKGWSAILPMMKTGSKWEVTIPSELAYAQRGFAPKIGPDAVLIFEMELLSIAPPAPASTNHPAPFSAQGPHPGPPTPPGTSTPVVSGQIIKVPSADELKKGAKIEVITNVPNQQ